MPLAYMLDEAHAYEKHVHEISAHKKHACEMYCGGIRYVKRLVM
jgi:hypothetical protein